MDLPLQETGGSVINQLIIKFDDRCGVFKPCSYPFTQKFSQAPTFISIPKFYLNTFPGGITGWGFLINHAIKWIENGAPFEPIFRNLFSLLLKHGKSANQVFPTVLTNEQLNQIQTPTLLIDGEKEVIYDYSFASRRAQRCLKNVLVEIIPNANHITGNSQPDLTNIKILKFLSSTN